MIFEMAVWLIIARTGLRLSKVQTWRTTLILPTMAASTLTIRTFRGGFGLFGLFDHGVAGANARQSGMPKVAGHHSMKADLTRTSGRTPLRARSGEARRNVVLTEELVEPLSLR